jgi:BirA family biotin operon repressor/biotin-[acetyl-CoA-carboxylase] ligase
MLDLDVLRSRLPSCWRLTWHDRVSSTNDLAAAAALLGAPEGTVIGAESQAAGRGRWGRTWVDDPGRSLLFSVVARPPGGAPIAWLGPVAALAAVRAGRDLGAAPLAFRWPNDVVCPLGKVAGVLVEQAGDAFVVGLGVNALGPAGEIAPGVPVATVESAGADALSREVLLVSLLDHLAALYAFLIAADAPSLLSAVASADALPGRRITIAAQGTEVEGRYLGMDEKARLILETDCGRMTFPAGEVTHVVD